MLIVACKSILATANGPGLLVNVGRTEDHRLHVDQCPIGSPGKRQSYFQGWHSAVLCTKTTSTASETWCYETGFSPTFARASSGASAWRKCYEGIPCAKKIHKAADASPCRLGCRITEIRQTARQIRKCTNAAPLGGLSRHSSGRGRAIGGAGYKVPRTKNPKSHILTPKSPQITVLVLAYLLNAGWMEGTSKPNRKAIPTSL